MNNYKICKRCVMDSSDPDITFNEKGTCSHCDNFDKEIKPSWIAGKDNDHSLIKMGEAIKARNKNKDFDCIIGLSGGLDSSYTAYIAVEKMGLRPLLFHVDAGWNTDQAVSNIEKLVDGLGLDLYTDVVNWESVRKMQVAFLRSGIPDQDLVQDAAFFSGLYRFAREYNVKDILTGSNFSTECCREPEDWGGYLGIDKTLFNDVWKKCGDGTSNSDFPLVDIIVYKFWYQKAVGMKVHHPLNLVSFLKSDAEGELNSKFGWQKFQHKHHESRFTRFYEDYWLPNRFGFEKRRAHFSSLVMTDQMDRVDALERLSKPELDSHLLQQEFQYVANKLELNTNELEALFAMPVKTFNDYKNKRWLIRKAASAMRFLGLEKRYI